MTYSSQLGKLNRMASHKIVIVIPTVNEEENIDTTLSMLREEFTKIDGHDMHVLVVDGNSKDRTQEIVNKHAADDSHIHLLLERPGGEGGLGGAYILAMKHAMSELGADTVMEMDADLQHNPQYIHDMIAAVDNGADVAVGTRFIKGGSIPREWGLLRKFLSGVGNIYARLCTGMYRAHDITSGFRLTTVAGYLDQVDLDNLLSKRFAYKMDLYYRLHKLGATIAEVPIKFEERELGESKLKALTNLNNNDWLDSYIVVMLIFLERIGLLQHKRFMQVALIGIFGGLVQFTTYNILDLSVTFKGLFLGFFSEEVVLAAIAIEAAIISNFLLNHHWAFKDRKNGNHWFSRLVQFNVLSSGSIVIQLITVSLGLRFFGNDIRIFGLALLANLYQAVGIWLGLIWNYLSYSRIVWRAPKQ